MLPAANLLATKKRPNNRLLGRLENHHKGACPLCGGFGALRGIGQAAPEFVNIDLVAAAQITGVNKRLTIDIDVMRAVAIIFPNTRYFP